MYQVRTLFAVPLWGLLAPLRAGFYSFDLSLPLTRCVPNQAGPFVPVTLGLTRDEVSARHYSPSPAQPTVCFFRQVLAVTQAGLEFTLHPNRP